MAATIAKLAKYPGSRDVWGGHGVIFLNYTGPNPYAIGPTGGDEVDSVGAASGNQTGLRNIDCIIPTMSKSGTYLILPQPSSTGPTKTWVMRWFTAVGMAEVVNGTDLSGETAILTVIGG